MLPTDLGLPAKFGTWRRGQEDTVIAAASSEKRFYMLSMPTGGGKSAVYMGVSKMLDARALVLTGTKGLQAQLIGDFKSMGLVEVKGQSNYKCIKDSVGAGYANMVMCNDGSCHSGVECHLRNNGCLYYDAVRVGAKSQLVVANYAYWMTMNRYSDPEALGKFDLLILDEAHAAPEFLAEFCTIEIDRSELHALLDMELPPVNEDREVISEWATKARAQCIIKYQAAKNRVHEGAKYVKLVRRLIDLGRRLAELANAHKWRRAEPAYNDASIAGVATDWLGEEVLDPVTRKPKAVRFSPVWAHAYAEQYLFKSIPRVLMVSATLQPKAAKYLGVGAAQYEFHEAASTFDPKRRPLYHVPTTEVGRNMSDGQVRIWLNKIDAIIESRLDRKGIIHTRSYDRAQLILANSRHRNILMSHGSRNARDVVEAFKRAKAPKVLVSPSMETGWDFPYDQCEYQIIAKIPFMDTRSRVITARAKSDKKYLNYMTVLSLIQTYGRGMRAEDDSCETFIIDDQIDWFKPASKEFWPKWFSAAFSRHPGIPAPMKKQTRKAVVI